MTQAVLRPLLQAYPAQRAGNDWRSSDPVLLSRNAFEALAAREFACADRYGHTHAMLEVEAGPSDSPRRAVLLEALSTRLRFVDAAGLLPGGRLGVLILYTDPESIQRLVRNLCRATGEQFEVSHWRARFHHGKSLRETSAAAAGAEIPGAADEFGGLVGESPALAVQERKRQVQTPVAEAATEVEEEVRLEPGAALSGCEPAGLVALTSRPLPLGKRLLDLVVASAGLLVLSPLLLVLGCLVALTSKGSVFYSQERTGRGLRRFRMYKFRTMHVESESLLRELATENEMSGPLFKMHGDPRCTRLGVQLRRLSLDELPQLWNVLKGDMTLIGPRALSPLPSQYQPWQLRRFDVTPGLACTWQAESRGNSDFDEWMRYDLRYLDDGVTATGDLRILLKTAWAVLTCSGSR